MKTLKHLAIKKNIIIICTIHQPSRVIYDLFDKMLILSQGRVAFCGTHNEAKLHFKSIGYTFPISTNPSEYMLELVNSDFTDKSKVNTILNKWEIKMINNRPNIIKIVTNLEVNSIIKNKVSYYNQVKTLFNRHLILSIRDPLMYTGRMIFFLLCGIFFATVYIESRDYTLEQSLSRVFLFMWIMAVPSMMGVIMVYVCNNETKSINKEVKNGLLPPSAYILSKTLIELPIMIILAISILSIGGYIMLQFNSSNIGLTIIVLSCMLWFFECMAQLMALLFTNPLIGMMGYVQSWFLFFLFAGMFSNDKDIIWPFRAISYISPLKYTLRTLVYLDYHAQLFDCSNKIICNRFLLGNKLSGDIVMDYIGKTSIPSISSDNTVYSDIGIIIGIAIFFKIIYIILMILYTNKSSKLK